MRRGWLVPVLVLGVSACATVAPPAPQSLLEARTAMGLAKQANADLLATEEYQAAYRALSRAEAAFAAEQSAPVLEDAAFEAQVTAVIAQSRARARVAAAELAQVRQSLAQQQAVLQALQQKNAVLEQAAQKLKASRADQASAEAAATSAAQKAQEAEAARAKAEAEAEMLRRAQRIQDAKVRWDSRGLVINLSGRVLFDTGSSKLQPGAMSQLDPIADLLKDYPEPHVRIEGHTDATGDLLTNNLLSQARAESVLSYLNQKGVPLDRLGAVGMGSSRPVATNQTPAGRQLNRRVEIILEKVPAPAAAPTP